MPSGNHPPIRALLISLAALAVPVAGAFWVPGALQDYEALLWMLAVVPAFLLAYYRAWRGAAIALAAAMAVVSVTYAITQVIGHPMPDLMLGVLIVVIAVSLGAGALADRIYHASGRSGANSFTDPATGLPNRAHADLHLETAFSEAAGRPLAVVLFDVDNFKGYNTRHGAIAGDEVLRMLAEVLKKTTRRMNLSARYAEDEFMAVLTGADEEGAIAYVKRFMQTLQEFAGERALPPISGGIAGVKPSMESYRDLVSAARTALRQAKKEGRGRIRVFGRPLHLSLASDTAPATLDATPAAAPDARSVMPQGRGRGRRVLIVADQQPVRALLSRYLNDHGFAVTQASNIVDGVQHLASEYDLLFTDISLHEGLGAELVRAAKLRWPSIQVMGLVPEATGDAMIETLNAGVDRFLVTPLDLPRVRAHIAELLGRHDRLVASVLENRQLSLEYEARTQDAVKELRRTEEEYDGVVRSVHEVVFRTDIEGNFTFLNDSWQEVTGYGVKATIGRAAEGFVAADDRADFNAALRSLATGERENVRAELRLSAQDGSLRWVELRARRLFDADSNVMGVTGTLEDVTPRRAAAEALQRSEAASRGLLAALPDEVLLISEAGVVLDHEGSAAADTSRARHVGESIERIFPPHIADDVQQLIQSTLATGDVQIYEYAAAEEKGGRRFEVRLAPSAAGAVVAVIRDITDSVVLEAQLRQSQKLEAIGRLAGGLAHDFNNLLTVIQGNTHLLTEEAQSRQAQDYLEQISLAAERGAMLVRQLLAFGRRQVLQPATLNLSELVDNARAMLSRLIGENIVLEVDLDPDIGLIKADPGQIEQVLINLAVNARDVITENGTLRITTRKGAFAIHGTADTPSDDVVTLTVTDNGPGMDAATLSRVFEPFFTTKGLAHASGLGLATVYGIVRQSGGSINVASEPGEGTTFEIAFPRIDS